MPTIKQIIPAHNWWVRFKNDDGTFYYERASCWALWEKPYCKDEKMEYINLMGSDQFEQSIYDSAAEAGNFDRALYSIRDLTDCTIDDYKSYIPT